MGYLGGQRQVGTRPFSAAGRKSTLVRVLPLALCQLPEPVYHVLTSSLGKEQISQGFVAVILGVLACSGLVFAQLQTLGSASHSWPLDNVFSLVFLAF